jgi:hypothetical protein
LNSSVLYWIVAFLRSNHKSCKGIPSVHSQRRSAAVWWHLPPILYQLIAGGIGNNPSLFAAKSRLPPFSVTIHHNLLHNHACPHPLRQFVPIRCKIALAPFSETICRFTAVSATTILCSNLSLFCDDASLFGHVFTLPQSSATIHRCLQQFYAALVSSHTHHPLHHCMPIFFVTMLQPHLPHYAFVRFPSLLHHCPLTFFIAPSSAQASSLHHCVLHFSIAPSITQASSSQLHQPPSTSSLRLIIFIDALSRAHHHGCAVTHSTSSAPLRLHLHCPFYLHRRARCAIVFIVAPTSALIFIVAPVVRSSSSFVPLYAQKCVPFSRDLIWKQKPVSVSPSRDTILSQSHAH